MADNWISGAISRPGAFSAKAKNAGMSTSAYASKKADAPGRLGRQARLAKTLMGMPKHAEGTVATPTEPPWWTRLGRILGMSPAKDALSKAAGSTTSAPSASAPAQEYNGYEMVRKAAEEAGKRNEAAKDAVAGQGASKNLPAHATGAVVADSAMGSGNQPMYGDYGRPAPAPQRMATPNGLPSTVRPGAPAATSMVGGQGTGPVGYGVGQPPMGSAMAMSRPSYPPLPGRGPVNPMAANPMASRGAPPPNRRVGFGNYPRING